MTPRLGLGGAMSTLANRPTLHLVEGSMSPSLRPRFVLFGCALVLPLALGCGGGDGATDPGPGPNPAPVASVTVTPDNSLVVVDDVGQLTAQPKDSAGTSLTGRTVTWSSLDETLATVSATGQVSALSYGDARIVAASEGKSDTVVVRARLRFTQISAGMNMTCGLLASGAAWCWGLNANGMLGARLSGDTSQAPVRVADGHRFTTISVGQAHACALDQDLAAWCWGGNFSGSLGTGMPDQNANAPARVTGDHRFLTISAGPSITCATDESHLAYCWGSAFRNLIPGRADDAAFPVAIAAPPDYPGPLTFDSIKTGLGDNCGIAGEIDGGDLWCWGDDSFGQLVDASTDPVYALIGVPLTPSDFGVGVNFICYTGVDRGDRQTPIAQCRGTDMASGAMTPNTVNDLPSIAGAVAMDVGAAFACALLNGGELRCWGANSEGQLGVGAASGPVEVPVVPLGGHHWTAIDLGFSHACGIDTDGIVYCWGENASGKLGDGTPEERDVPTAVVGQL